ncbi:MAG TPA: CoA pyrophosphatase [Actinomycetes bacterium]|nr:CoA pyrophosphatase [Actinomycetes bacterium]
MTPPSWLEPLRRALPDVKVHDLTRFPAPADSNRRSAVLVLFGENEDGEPDVLLIERAHDMRSHAGQPAFPGGRMDDTDDGPVAAALREAQEETGLDPMGVDVLGVLPDLYVPPSDFSVTPVVAWWREASPVSVVDTAEVASVHRVTLRELTDPDRRCRVRHPSGFVGPAFEVRGLLVWGFTGGLLDRLIHLGGWERPWDPSRVVPLPPLPGERDDPVVGEEASP